MTIPITGVGSTGPASKIRGPIAAASSQTSSVTAAAPTDSVEVSPIARSMQQLAALPPIRRHLVDVVRAEIETGRYETPQRLDRAVESLANDLA